MRGDDGLSGDGEHIEKGFVGDVRDVHHHSNSVHLAIHFFAEFGEAVVGGLIGGRIGPVVVAEVGERHGANAHALVHAEHVQVVGDLVSAFQRQDGGDLTRVCDTLDVGGGGGKLDPVGILVEDGLH